jgi:hypothetical protein
MVEEVNVEIGFSSVVDVSETELVEESELVR